MVAVWSFIIFVGRKQQLKGAKKTIRFLGKGGFRQILASRL
jgi:hypothetical protein